MTNLLSRRKFLGQSVAAGLGAAGAALVARSAGAAEPGAKPPGIPPLTVISGTPRERGRSYGRQFKDAIHRFIDREIFSAFDARTYSKDELLRYAAACEKEIRALNSEIHDELAGLAEGAGFTIEEIVLLTLHEELSYKGVLPKVEHCTAFAVAPADTGDGNAYVGQTWDWMESVAGLSSVLHWKRQTGPSLLSFSFPGLWVGAGMNSAGLALCWTSAIEFEKLARSPSPRVGVPAYVLLTHLLYQSSLDEVAEAAQRANNAGWFTFVLGDSRGRLLNIEGSPEKIVVEPAERRLVRAYYGSRAMTATPPEASVPLFPRCRHLYDLLGKSAGRNNLSRLQELLQNPAHGICVGRPTIDLMVFNTTRREAWFSRGPAYGVEWQRFSFDGAAALPQNRRQEPE